MRPRTHTQAGTCALFVHLNCQTVNIWLGVFVYSRYLQPSVYTHSVCLCVYVFGSVTVYGVLQCCLRSPQQPTLWIRCGPHCKKKWPHLFPCISFHLFSFTLPVFFFFFYSKRKGKSLTMYFLMLAFHVQKI